MPAEDINATAYQYFCSARSVTDLQQAKANADYAQQLANDPQLKLLSGLLARSTDIMLSSGIKARNEAQGFTAALRVAVAQGKDPFLLLQGLGVSWDQFWNDPDKVEKEVDARYVPYFNQIQQANQSAGTTMLFSFLIVLATSFAVRVQLLNKISAYLAKRNSAPIIEAQPEASLVTCPGCGARNRNKILTSGQKLVCGQCKTVLLSVS